MGKRGKVEGTGHPNIDAVGTYLVSSRSLCSYFVDIQFCFSKGNSAIKTTSTTSIEVHKEGVVGKISA